MKIDTSKIIEKRKNRAWTQSHLAEVCGLSLRTIQRIEKTGVASQESIQALASVFECHINDLVIEDTQVVQESKRKDKKELIVKLAYLLIAIMPLIILFTTITGTHLIIDVSKDDGIRRTISSSSTLYMLLVHTKLPYLTLIPGVLLLLYKKMTS